MSLMLILTVGKDNDVVYVDACEANTSVSIGVEVWKSWVASERVTHYYLRFID
eukprot:SAG11_NODE_23962_length_380_cov_0.996441_1_plen_53_part_00